MNIGDYIRFGTYNNEKVEWKIIDKKNNNALIVSSKIIELSSFGNTNNYLKSKVRKWLNDTFYNTAFTDEEKERIVATEIDNSYIAASNDYADAKNFLVDIYCSDNTIDKIFLLSQQEVTSTSLGFEATDDDSKSREVFATDRLIEKYKGKYNLNGCVMWWLRTPVCQRGFAGLVIESGYLSGNDSRIPAGIRPALWIKL